MKRILGFVFVVVVLALLYFFTQEDNSAGKPTAPQPLSADEAALKNLKVE